jgi:glucose/arabinose dehydrogenase
MHRRPFCQRPARIALPMLAGVSFLVADAYSADSFDPTTQIGPNPVLPEPQQYLFPPMHLAKVVGWKQGEAPTVASGLKIEALAQNLQHPRSLYVLPNGDILIVESKSPDVQPIRRPKDIVMGLVESWMTSGGNPRESNRITLLRDEKGDGKPKTQKVLLDHLASPFGVALVGTELYVANTDAIVRYPYTPGETTISHPERR